jgi:hypothetical protein
MITAVAFDSSGTLYLDPPRLNEIKDRARFLSQPKYRHFSSIAAAVQIYALPVFA